MARRLCSSSTTLVRGVSLRADIENKGHVAVNCEEPANFPSGKGCVNSMLINQTMRFRDERKANCCGSTDCGETKVGTGTLEIESGDVAKRHSALTISLSVRFAEPYRQAAVESIQLSLVN